jgi:hypothetical protein
MRAVQFHPVDTEQVFSGMASDEAIDPGDEYSHGLNPAKWG